MQTRSLGSVSVRARARVAAACDLCKLRKVKCSGGRPCSYCVRRGEPSGCCYTAPRRRRPPARSRASPSPPPPPPASADPASAGPAPSAESISRPGLPLSQHEEHEEHEETEVPREARLLCDAQGKLIFIGDCAPLSFFQTVRRLVTTRVDPQAFAPETSGYSALENVYSRPGPSAACGAAPPPVTVPVAPAVSAYLEATAGLVDLFDNARLADDIAAWVEQGPARAAAAAAADLAAAVNYLVLAIGCQNSDAAAARAYFEHARQVAFASLSGNLGVASVQAFILITLYSLAACQINAAFLFFGIAARAAYSIGIHRSAVNARFGPDIHRQRDRLWKSLRVVDLFLSTSMGRPPATSDVDCTVPYRDPDEAGRERFDLLNASAQIFLVIEAVVLEVYSRRKISPRLTEGISRELREWSSRWLQRLTDVAHGTSSEAQPGMANGACQILASYYYAVILVSRPFLMVELHRRLADGHSSAAGSISSSSSGGGGGGVGLMTGKSKLADACIDAAILMVEPVQGLIERRLMTRRAPVVVSWLFASSLVLGVGLLGGFGRIIEKYCRASIAALEHFAQADAHALQYSLIAKSLLGTALAYLEKRELQERRQRTESSSQLFGLIPPASSRGAACDADAGRGLSRRNRRSTSPGASPAAKGLAGDEKTHPGHSDSQVSRLGFDFDSTLFGWSETLPRTPDFSLMGGSLESDAEQTLGALNLFPLLETDGHIDLANYF